MQGLGAVDAPVGHGDQRVPGRSDPAQGAHRGLAVAQPHDVHRGQRRGRRECRRLGVLGQQRDETLQGREDPPRDLDLALEKGFAGRMQNNAQSCIAAKRFILEDSIAEPFIERFTDRMDALTIGDPMDEATDLGPLAREDLRDGVHDQVMRSIEQGAVCATGGHKLERAGYFYAPTVLTEVAPGNVAFEEEIFGPVASMIVADDAEHTVELANDTRFGLGGAVFTEDRAKGESIARRLDVGCAFVNEMVKSDPRLPFGGIKDSGYGRELSHHGIRAFVNAKTVWIA